MDIEVDVPRLDYWEYGTITADVWWCDDVYKTETLDCRKKHEKSAEEKEKENISERV